MKIDDNFYNILVFGASGFIGTYLIDYLLSEGFNVVATDIDPSSKNFYDSKGVEFHTVDITKEKDFLPLENISIDTVIHLAACQPANVSKDDNDPKEYFDVNVQGTINILEYCRSNCINKVIYGTSHRNTQGLWGDNKFISEDDGICIKYNTGYTLFSISETTAQNLMDYYFSEYGINTVTFRFPPVYGYGPHTEIFLDGNPIKTGFQIFIDKAQNSQPIEVWGDCECGRDIVYIKDVLKAFLCAVNLKKLNGLFNISSGKRLTLLEEAQTIVDVFWGGVGLPTIIKRPDLDNGIDDFCYDISKAKAILGWEPTFTFRDMLLDFIKESDSEKFRFLLEKRRKILTQS